MAELARFKTTRHHNQSAVWTIVGMSLGFFSYVYASSIIGTSLGNQSLLSRALSSNVSSGQPSFYIHMDFTTRNDVPALIGTATGLFYAGGAFGVVLNKLIPCRQDWTKMDSLCRRNYFNYRNGLHGWICEHWNVYCLPIFRGSWVGANHQFIDP
jgi:hypothetical protein